MPGVLAEPFHMSRKPSSPRWHSALAATLLAQAREALTAPQDLREPCAPLPGERGASYQLDASRASAGTLIFITGP